MSKLWFLLDLIVWLGSFAVDCIDCAADASVVNAVNDGIDAALEIASVRRPWVMISVNDDRNDLHFRKAGELLFQVCFS